MKRVIAGLALSESATCMATGKVAIELEVANAVAKTGVLFLQKTEYLLARQKHQPKGAAKVRVKIALRIR